MQKHEIITERATLKVLKSGSYIRKWFPAENYDCDYFKKSNNICSNYLRQFFYNNSYLLKLTGATISEQLDYFREQGIRIHKSTIKKYRAGIVKSCSLVYLSFFSNYWDISIPIMMGEDFEALDKLGKLDLDQLRG